MNEEDNKLNITERQTAQDNKITKIDRQADVLDQARLRPHIIRQ
jgi:hypothetical protein